MYLALSIAPCNYIQFFVIWLFLKVNLLHRDSRKESFEGFRGGDQPLI